MYDGCKQDFECRSSSISEDDLQSELLFTNQGRTSILFQTERDNAMLSTDLNESMDLEEGIRACKVRESLKANCEVKSLAKKLVKDK